MSLDADDLKGLATAPHPRTSTVLLEASSAGRERKSQAVPYKFGTTFEYTVQMPDYRGNSGGVRVFDAGFDVVVLVEPS